MATDAAICGLEARDGSPAVATVQSIIDRSREVFNDTAQPRGLYEPLAVKDFDEIYRGRGDNDEDTPLEHVVDEAVSLALFAVTLGDQISDRISALFDAGELAEGYILDQVASFAADELADIAARRFQNDSERNDLVVLPYSPGYCGWHVSGQEALFARLGPGEIGISLNDSCLMHPIKSVSGVLVLAPVEAHDFSPAFPCCATCTTLACQERVASLRPRSG
ncbi:MAG: hypothetical protein OQK55_03000 [Thermoanaerobaculales bacterium]|nr:hypothetical protein [Thermoanaerobaculales bacterium]